MTKIDILSAGVSFLTKWRPFFIFSFTYVCVTLTYDKTYSTFIIQNTWTNN